MDLSQAKQIVETSDVEEWNYWDDPDVWSNQGEEMTIEAIHEFSEERADSIYADWAETAFDEPEVRMGRIRIKHRGVPYFEGDVVYVGQQLWKAYIPLPSGLDEDEQTRLTDFNYGLGKVLTEASSSKEFDEVLEIGNIERS